MALIRVRFLILLLHLGSGGGGAKERQTPLRVMTNEVFTP